VLSLDPNIELHGLQHLLGNGLADRFPRIIKKFEDRLQEINEEQQNGRSTIAAQSSALVEANVRKAETLLRRLFLEELLRTYPYVVLYSSLSTLRHTLQRLKS
jgi:hypothetical protein